MTPALTTTANLHAAFERVKDSHGMAGVDGITIAEFAQNLSVNLQHLAFDLESGQYLPLPLLRFLVAKKDGTPRALTVPTVRDRTAQAAALNVIGPVFEAEFEDCSFAYRKGRSVKLAAYRIQELRDQGYRYVVEADIDSYFDNIDHDLLFEKIQTLIPDKGMQRLLRLWVQAEIYDGKGIQIQQKGISQGTVISPMLANLFLDEFDEALNANGFKLVRYSDDFVILAKNRDLAKEALDLTEETLAHLLLELDEEDTRVTDFDKGFRFLGLVFAGDAILQPFDRPKKDKKVLYMPPPFNLKEYLAERNRRMEQRPEDLK